MLLHDYLLKATTILSFWMILITNFFILFWFTVFDYHTCFAKLAARVPLLLLSYLFFHIDIWNLGPNIPYVCNWWFTIIYSYIVAPSYIFRSSVWESSSTSASFTQFLMIPAGGVTHHWVPMFFFWIPSFYFVFGLSKVLFVVLSGYSDNFPSEYLSLAIYCPIFSYIRPILWFFVMLSYLQHFLSIFLCEISLFMFSVCLFASIK